MRLKLAAVTLLAVALFTACSSPQTPTSSGLRVLTTTTFLADIAQNVVGERIKVDSLIPVGADPHEYQLTPQDTTKIAVSQVLIANGVGYETWLKKTLDNVGGQRLLIVASSGLTPRARCVRPKSRWRSAYVARPK